MIPHFKKVYSIDFEVNKLQSNAEEVLNALTTSPFINGIFVTILIGTGDTVISHKLQRDYQGWVVTDIDTDSVIYRSPTVNTSKNRQLILRASAAATTTLYIF